MPKDYIDKEIENAPKCGCPCHKYPGAYSCEPCAYCKHYNSEGQMLGGIIYGIWVGHRYELSEEEQRRTLNKQF